MGEEPDSQRDPEEETPREAPRRRRQTEHRPEDRIPRLDRRKERTLNFGMSFVYWSASAVCFLVAVTVLTNLGSGEKPDSDYLLVAGGAIIFGLLLVWAGFRSYRSAADQNDDDR